jgi:hypothetical protein
MIFLALALFLSTLGGTLVLHYLKNFLLKEKTKFYLDWDGLLERLSITYIIISVPDLWLFIPLIIALKILFRLALLGFMPGISQTREPGTSAQKVLLKAELAFDLFLSPALAILVGVVFR